jgi:hypothetical protein
MDEVRLNGPIVGGLQYYSSIKSYNGGIMNEKFGDRINGYYYVKLLGWGVAGNCRKTSKFTFLNSAYQTISGGYKRENSV